MERIISVESAREQLQKLLDFYSVDLNEIGENKIGKTVEKRLVDAISYGRLEVELSDTVVVKQNLRNGKVLSYGEVSGQAKIAMERYSNAYEKLYELISALTKQPRATIQSLTGSDLSLVEGLALIFLAQ